MKDRKCDKHHVRSKTRSGCLAILCYIRGHLTHVSKLNGHLPSRYLFLVAVPLAYKSQPICRRLINQGGSGGSIDPA